MKRIYYIIILISLIGLSSCKKFLMTEPTDFLNPSNYYETEQQLAYARAGVYNTLGAGPLYGTYSQYVFPLTADEGYMNRPTATIGTWSYSYSSSDSYNTEFWANLYDGINRANVLLANIDKNPKIDEAKRSTIRGEALFLRAYFYFILVQFYGGVPLKIEPTASVVNVNIPRSSVKEVYEQIIRDMTAAEPLVPGIAALGYGGAISKSAVRGILARVNLTMAGYPLRDESRYAEAKKWARMVMDDKEAGHRMNPSYPQIFMNLAGDKYDIKESIWEVEFWGNLTDQYTESGNLGYINGPSVAEGAATGRVNAFMRVTAKLYNIFEPGDLRKFFCISSFTYKNSQINGDKTLTAPPKTELAKYSLYPAKWRREYETLLPKSSTRTPENLPLLRYTDVLLMYAEAENAINGPTPEAVNIINQVRQRAWSSGVNTIAITNGGSGYKQVPQVVFSETSGSGAAATAVISSAGKVTAITLNRDPAGVTFNLEGRYTAPPTITLVGGAGTGATATATINYLEDANLKAAQIDSKAHLLAVIQDERMREFNFETMRKTDLLRWGIFLQVHQDMGNTIKKDAPGVFYIMHYTNVSEKDLLMPIPSDEMTVNTAMKQNPGWQ